jgi:predicted RNA binding protein YcfA (HicA-like mRNA interferase family)
LKLSKYDAFATPFRARVHSTSFRAGFRFGRQKGSHYIKRRDSPKRRVVIPVHEELGVGLLKAIIRDAGLTAAEFIDLL